MKFNFFEGKGGKIILFVCCLFLAIAFWFMVKYGMIEGLSTFGS